MKPVMLFILWYCYFRAAVIQSCFWSAFLFSPEVQGLHLYISHRLVFERKMLIPPHRLQVLCVCLLVLVVRNDFYSEDEWSPCLVCKIVSVCKLISCLCRYGSNIWAFILKNIEILLYVKQYLGWLQLRRLSRSSTNWKVDGSFPGCSSLYAKYPWARCWTPSCSLMFPSESKC